MLRHSKMARHGDRDVSVTPIDRSVERLGASQEAAAEILNAALSEDSLGLTPPRPAGRRERAASGPRSRRDLMPHRTVLRSTSGARKTRASPRAALPEMQWARRRVQQ